MLDNYKLNENGEPERVDDALAWAEWYETADCHVGYTMLGDVRISTVFLGIDHQFGEGPPILWETMVFGGALDQEQVRYATRAEALAGHQDMVMRVMQATVH